MHDSFFMYTYIPLQKVVNRRWKEILILMEDILEEGLLF